MLNNMAYICENEYENFLKLPNVNGIGIGHKIINGIDTHKPCLTILVENKVYESELIKENIVPKSYKGFITDVIEVGEINAFAFVSKVRPTICGYSVGVVGSTAGTLGCLVSTKTGSELTTYILSNNHVLALENAASIGSSILQPGPADGGTNPSDSVANLSQFVPLNFSGGDNIVDAAIAKVISTTLVSSQIQSIGNIKGIASAVIGTPVQKSGRTTEYTTGTIQTINTTINVGYGGGKTARFIKQITTSPMAQGGDSGSILLDNSSRVIGLLFAGSTSMTAYNDIRDVLKSFKARLV